MNIVFEKGRLIKDFVLYDKNEALLIKANSKTSFKIDELYCGDYSIWFIVKFDSKGDEITRYNLRYIGEFTYL